VFQVFHYSNTWSLYKGSGTGASSLSVLSNNDDPFINPMKAQNLTWAQVSWEKPAGGWVMMWSRPSVNFD
jgi:hypothetical protein